MMNYKTRSDSLPSGKSKIFFYCHPSDFSDCFERISDELLDFSNCAVFYSENGYKPSDCEWDSFNLIVIAVSKILLTSDDPLLEYIIESAKSKNIPILPLMQQGGLYSLFTEKFGKIQYLYEYQNDDTAIPYKEKLKSFLKSVLLEDEQAGRIRSAFDAYIFLSYRKKDREYARKLMSLIHKNDFARRVAIWYDEFLVPGEDFNELIKDALTKSSLFVLNVTPNLVNEDNYISRVEYPLAVQEGKKITPVEMVHTDKSELRSKFTDIPDAVDSLDEEALTQALKDGLSQCALGTSDDPIHRFFIGLAYLNGIDVEKDYDIALEMITSAAKDGLDEAYEKLSDMYFYGEGVGQDYQTSFKWLRELIYKYGDKLESSKKIDRNDFIRAASLSMELGRKAFIAEDYIVSRDSYQQCIDGCKALLVNNIIKHPLKNIVRSLRHKDDFIEEMNEIVLIMIRSYHMLMNACFKIGSIDEACNAGGQADNLVNTWQFITVSKELYFELTDIYGSMFLMCLESGNKTNASAWFEKEKQLFSNYDDESRKAHDASVYEHSGLLGKAYHDRDRAVTDLGHAYNRYLELFKEYRNDLYLERTTFCAYSLTDVYLAIQDYRHAGEVLGELEIVLNKYKENIDKRYYEKYIAFIYARKGKIILDNGSEGADECEEKILPYLETACDECVNSRDTGEIIGALMFEGDLKLQKGLFKDAEEYYLKAETFITDTIAFTRSIRDTRYACEVHEKLFRFYADRKYFVLAFVHYDLADNFRKMILESTGIPEDRDALESLSKQMDVFEDNDKNVPDGVCDLSGYLKKNSSNAASDKTDEEMEEEISKILLDYWNYHRNAKFSNHVYELGRYLKDKKDDNKALNKLCSTIKAYILNEYKPFLQYDEESNIILLYCWYKEICAPERKDAAKDEEIKRLHDFRKDNMFIFYPIDYIKYPDVWAYLYRLTGS